MPRRPAPKISEEFPPNDRFQALVTRLETFGDDPIAQVLIRNCHKAMELERKEGKAILKNEILQSDNQPAGLGNMESRLRGSSSLLERVLVREGHRDAVTRIKRDYSGLVPRTEQLLKLGTDSKKDSVRALRKEADQDLARFTEADARAKTGGHPLFDDHATAVARKLWVALDNAYDGLSICLRSAGISHDPVLATRPTVKTPLRPVLNVKPKVKHHAARGNKKNGPGDGKSASPPTAPAPQRPPSAKAMKPASTGPAADEVP